MFNSVKTLLTRADADWAKCVQIASRKALMTPDLEQLQTQLSMRVFIYNEVQSGQPAHSKLGVISAYGGLGYTSSPDYVMWKKELGKETFPFAMQVEDDQKHGMSSLIGDPGQIMGELYTIRPYQIVELDNYMLNTVMFERKVVKVMIPFKTDPKKDSFDVQETDAHMYVGRREFWNSQINDLDAKLLFKRSERIFNAKSITPEENTLNAYYVFDHAVEAVRK